MGLSVSINGDSSGSDFLIAPPSAIRPFRPHWLSAPRMGLPVKRGLKYRRRVPCASGQHASSASAGLNDVMLEISLDGCLEAPLTLTSIASPRI
jgi:hypothetical protein